MAYDNNAACRRAMEAIEDMCGTMPARSDRSGGGEHNTIYMEIVVEQGRTVDSSDVDEIATLVEEFVDGMIDMAGVGTISASSREVVTVSGTERPNPMLSDESPVFLSADDNRIHSFIKIENDTLSVEQIDAISEHFKRTWQNGGGQTGYSDPTTGRGLNSVNIVDERIVHQVAPGRAGMPIEDAAFIN